MHLAPGVLISSPTSGSGKTIISLGLIRAMLNAGLKVGSAKVGPDYIDPRFHEAASNRRSYNLDGWSMRPETLSFLTTKLATNLDILIVEGAMGLFDGAIRIGNLDDGSSACLAERMNWPVILVIDASSQAQSVAAIATGFRDFRPKLNFGGVILNRVASSRHEHLLTSSLKNAEIKVLGIVPRTPDLKLPSRHLGLIQATEHSNINQFIQKAAHIIDENLDIQVILGLASPTHIKSAATPKALLPLGQRIALANDPAFGFSYHHIIEGWRSLNAEILPFSPLANQAPPESCDAIFLPGGYPELNAGLLSTNTNFFNGLKIAANKGKVIYGECGGYMALGRSLTDINGTVYPMAGILGLETTFRNRKPTIGYRVAETLSQTPFGPKHIRVRGHEFHYAQVVSEVNGDKFFKMEDAEGQHVSSSGLRSGSVFGSFLHIVDLCES